MPGAGRIKQNKTLEVKIPAGIDEGHAHPTRPATANRASTAARRAISMSRSASRQHEVFQRDGDDLHCEVPISITTAALGGEIEVPTLTRRPRIDIPEGMQNGKVFRLRGKGIKGVRSSYPGDLYCHVASRRRCG